MKAILRNVDVVLLTKALMHTSCLHIYHACIIAHHINLKKCRYMHPIADAHAVLRVCLRAQTSCEPDRQLTPQMAKTRS